MEMGSLPKKRDGLIANTWYFLEFCSPTCTFRSRPAVIPKIPLRWEWLQGASEKCRAESKILLLNSHYVLSSLSSTFFLCFSLKNSDWQQHEFQTELTYKFGRTRLSLIWSSAVEINIFFFEIPTCFHERVMR